jgi:hypothetical protein
MFEAAASDCRQSLVLCRRASRQAWYSEEAQQHMLRRRKECSEKVNNAFALLC